MYYTFQDKTGLSKVMLDVNNFKTLRDYSKSIQQFIGLKLKEINNMLGHRMVVQSFYAISGLKCVKEYIAKMQEEIIKNGSAIIEGLDIGDVDINKIKYKFFLTADIEQRVQRKLAGLREKNIYDITYEQLLNDTIESDNNSYVGEVSKIKLSQDINMIDTTDKTVEQIIEEITKIVEV